MVSTSLEPRFGHVGQAFVAQFGDMATGVGEVLSPVGFKVVRVDVETRVINDFAVNKGATNGPASWLGSDVKSGAAGSNLTASGLSSPPSISES